MLIDSHAHLDMEEFDRDREKVLERAIREGISRIITVGVDLSSSLKALKLAQTHDFVYSAIGYHPHNAVQAEKDGLKELAALTSEPKVVAWGEIGLDFYRGYSPPERQVEIFTQQLDLADQFGLPIIVHDRDAHQQVKEILGKRVKRKSRGVIHCFSGDYKLAVEFIQMGFYISIPGTVTYKKADQVREVAAGIPLEYLLLETDAPYLAPEPRRGRRNEPCYIVFTAREVARLRGLDLDEVARKTSENAMKLFNLPL